MQRSPDARGLRAGLYHRVSTDEQDPTLARRELRAAARARGLRVVLDIEEIGSGAQNDRPGLQELLASARGHGLDCVIVWKLTRFGRSNLDLLTNVQALTDVGVRFICTTQGLDVGPGGDAVSKLILSVLAGVAEFDLETIRDGTRLGMREAKARGIHVGRPSTAADNEIAMVLELRAGGHGYKAIAHDMELTRSMVRRIVAKHGGPKGGSNSLVEKSGKNRGVRKGSLSAPRDR